MATIDRIKNDWLQARKARETVRATLLGTLVGALTTREKNFNPSRPLSEADVIAEVKKMFDGVVTTGKLLAGADRPDDLAKSLVEQTILEGYMPLQMSEAEIEAFAIAKKAEGLNMGAIMLTLKAEFPGKFDGKLASNVVKRVLV